MEPSLSQNAKPLPGKGRNMDSFSVIHNSLHCTVEDRRVRMTAARVEEVR